MVDKKRQRLQSKLVRVFAIQLGIISLATLLGVFLSAKIVENVLIKQALDGEASYFWERYQANPDFPLPDTLNLTGYLLTEPTRDSLPDEYQQVVEGYHRVASGDNTPIVHVTQLDDELLVLVFEESQVRQLAFYFGIAPLALVLLLLYLPAWMTYIMSKRAISPVVQLAQHVENLSMTSQPDLNPDFDHLEQLADMEVASLIDAFKQYASRVNHFLQRERNFTRYASHELRTPLAVFNGSLAILRKTELTDKQAQIVSRMKPVIKDMEELLEALLLLSKDEEPQVSRMPIIINDQIEMLIHDLEHLIEGSDVKLEFFQAQILQARLPERLFMIVVANLLRNGISYTDQGTVGVTIADRRITIIDTGRGIAREELERVFEPFYRSDRDSCQIKGYGLGLAIVNRICDQMNWQITMNSEEGRGTRIELFIPESEVIGWPEQD